MTTVFITILNMSIAASIVALAVMLVRIPLRRAPKIFSYALWGVVLFRLVVPFSFESMFGFMSASTNVIPQNIVFGQTPMIETGVQFFDAPINAAIHNAMPATTVGDSINPIQVFFGIAGYVWLIGVIALLLYAVIGYIGLKRRVRFSTLVRENIYETDQIKTPFVLGLIRPKIYIPAGMELLQQDYILKHEQTHIKRFDYLVKPFAFLVCALHWFNPVVWASYFLMAKDMEMSCDEAVLRQSDEDIRGAYSSALLNLSMKRSGLLTPLAFGESNVKSRVGNVLNFKKPAIWIIIVSLLVVVAFSIGFASNRATENFNRPNLNHPMAYEEVVFSEFGIGVIFPYEYSGKYMTFANEDSIRVVHTATHALLSERFSQLNGYDSDYTFGTLFTIYRMALADESFEFMRSNSVLLFEDGEYAFLFMEPTDVQFDSENPESPETMEFFELSDRRLIEFIRDNVYRVPPMPITGIVYQFDQLGFALTFPAFWESKFGVSEFTVESAYGTRPFVEIYHIATREALGYAGTLFTLGSIPGEHYTEDDPPTPHNHIIMHQGGGYTFMMLFPSGVEYDETPGSETAAEYLDMASQWEFIVNSFQRF